MRLREPMKGFTLATGHWMFHIAFLLGSVFCIETKSSVFQLLHFNDINFGDNIGMLVMLVRAVHFIIALTQIGQSIFKSNGFDMFNQMFTVIQMFIYQGTILFEQQKLQNYSDEKLTTDAELSALYWVRLEVTAFYLYLASAAVFLFYIQVRGIMGKSDKQANKNRYKQDALEYYNVDIDWFAFIFVLLVLHLQAIYIFTTGRSQEVKGRHISEEGFTVLLILAIARAIQLIFLVQLRTQERFYKEHPMWIWLALCLLYAIGLFQYFGHNISLLASSLFVVDVVMFIQQFLFSYIHVQMEKETVNVKIQEDDDDEYQAVDAPKARGFASSVISFFKNTGTVQFEEEEEALKQPRLKIQDDIYSLAFASLVDTSKVDKEDLSNPMPDINLTNQEQDNIFFGALLVIGFQLVVIYLIVHYMETESAFHIVPATTFQIIVPRLLSSIMMHMKVEPEIRNGLNLMKYAVKHPQNIQISSASKEDAQFSHRKVFFAFFLGFAQACIAIFVEFCVVIYLASMTNLISIIISFASIATIVTFDDMYAAALFENRIKKAVGQQLKFEYKRVVVKNDEGALEETMEMKEVVGEGSFFLKFLRFVQKTIRMYYVSFNYYFMPFFAVILTFMYKE